MARKYTAAFEIPAGFFTKGSAPLTVDAVVENDVDLLSDADEDLPFIYEGMIVYSEESKKHYSWNGQDRTNPDNWETIGKEETITNLQIVNNILSYTNEQGTEVTYDLSLYLDDTNLARITQGTYDSGTQELVFIRDDNSEFRVDASMFFDDTNLVTSVNGQTGAVNIPIYTSTDFDTDFSNKSTDDLDEGNTNKYNRQPDYNQTDSNADDYIKNKPEFENKELAGSTIQVNSKSGVHYFADITSGNPVDISSFNIDELTVGAYAIIRSSTTAEPVVNNNADSKPVEKIGYTDFVLDELSGKVIDIIIEIKPFAVEVSYRYVKD